MKKWMALLIVVAMMVGACMAFAEEIDLSGLSDEEITTLMKRVQEEMVARHLGGTATLAKGKYIAGRDIPVGSYTLTSLAQGSDWGNLTIHTDKGEGEMLMWEIIDAPEDGEEQETFFITLEEDDRLECGVPFSLTVHTGLLFQ